MMTKYPKCKIELENYKPKIEGTGCDYCEPKCRYCGEYLKGFLMEHHQICKVFQEELKKEQEKI